MANQTLLLHQLIGEPIIALIEAESSAAQASAEFIETFGFIKRDSPSSTDIGDLRMITFSFEKQDVNGANTTKEMSIPVLSLIPIPLFQIKEATLQFDIKITEVSPFSKTSLARRRNVLGNESRFSLRGIFSRGPDVNADLKINITVTQSDIPAGLTKLFQVFDNAISSKKISKK